MKIEFFTPKETKENFIHVFIVVDNKMSFSIFSSPTKDNFQIRYLADDKKMVELGKMNMKKITSSKFNKIISENSEIVDFINFTIREQISIDIFSEFYRDLENYKKRFQGLVSNKIYKTQLNPKICELQNFINFTSKRTKK